MKKNTTKLSLNKSTVRLLNNADLVAVNGGAPTQAATVCFAPGTARCPGEGNSLRC